MKKIDQANFLSILVGADDAHRARTGWTEALKTLKLLYFIGHAVNCVGIPFTYSDNAFQNNPYQMSLITVVRWTYKKPQSVKFTKYIQCYSKMKIRHLSSRFY